MKYYIKALIFFLICLVSQASFAAENIQETVHTDSFSKTIVLEGFDKTVASQNVQIKLSEYPRYVDPVKVEPKCKFFRLRDQNTIPELCNVKTGVFFNVTSGQGLHLSATLPEPGTYKFEIFRSPNFEQTALDEDKTNSLNHSIQRQTVTIIRSTSEVKFSIATIETLSVIKPMRFWLFSGKPKEAQKDVKKDPAQGGVVEKDGTFSLDLTSTNALPIKSGLFYSISCGTHDRHFPSNQTLPRPFDCSAHKKIKIEKILPALGTMSVPISVDQFGPSGKYTAAISVYDANDYFTPQTTAMVVEIKEHWGAAAVVITIGLLVFSLMRQGLQWAIKRNRFLGLIWRSKKNISTRIQNLESADDKFKIGKIFIGQLNKVEKLLSDYRENLDDIEMKVKAYALLDDAFEIWVGGYDRKDVTQDEKDRLVKLAEKFGMHNIDIILEDVEAFEADVIEIAFPIKAELSQRPNTRANPKTPLGIPEYVLLRLIQLMFVLLPIAIISGLLLFWASTPTWGSEGDIMKALVWGASVNLFGSMAPEDWKNILSKFIPKKA